MCCISLSLYCQKKLYVVEVTEYRIVAVYMSGDEPKYGLHGPIIQHTRSTDTNYIFHRTFSDVLFNFIYMCVDILVKKLIGKSDRISSHLLIFRCASVTFCNHIKISTHVSNLSFLQYIRLTVTLCIFHRALSSFLQISSKCVFVQLSEEINKYLHIHICVIKYSLNVLINCTHTQYQTAAYRDYFGFTCYHFFFI